MLLSWLDRGKASAKEWMLASEGASVAWNERGSDHDATYGVVTCVIRFDARWEIPNASEVDRTELAAWLRKHTEPNFSTNIPSDEYTACRNYYMTRMKED